jgi:excisionase family DNA binding protein
MSEKYRGRRMKTEPWVSLEEIAEHLKVSTDTIHRWIRARRIPVQRVGRQWRFKVTEVDEWVQAGKAGTGRDVREKR